MTYDDAGDALNKMLWDDFKPQAQAILGYVPTVYWPFQTEPTSAPTDKFWMRVSRKNLPKTLSGFGEGNANKAARYDVKGNLFIQMFYPQADKNAAKNLPRLAEIAEACFLGKHDPSNLLWCRDIAVNPLESEKGWFRLNVVVEFIYQDIRS